MAHYLKFTIEYKRNSNELVLMLERRTERGMRKEGAEKNKNGFVHFFHLYFGNFPKNINNNKR